MGQVDRGYSREESVLKGCYQSERKEKNRGQEDGQVADFSHERFLSLLIHARDNDYCCIVCQQKIGDVRKNVGESEIKNERSGDQAGDDEELFRLRKR